MTDLDPIRERHWQNPDGKCASGDHAFPSSWPCDTLTVLTMLDEEIERSASALRASWEAHGETAADADRLAEALREVAHENHDPTGTKWHHPGTRYLPCSFDECQGPDCIAAREALRQHDAAKESARE